MKPTPKSYTFSISTSNQAIQKLQKSMPLPDLEENKKHESTTLAIRYACVSTDIKLITSNKITAKRKVKCLEITHYA